jgi:uncharacterized membrane protein YgdD (TMEM256/DUF423 family)
VRLGAVFAFLGVALGAFGTHSLRDRVPTGDLAIWATGVQYHTLHAVALIVIGLLCGRYERPQLRWAGWLVTAGITIFSGSLYLLVLTNVRVLGAITPIGGVCLLTGWLLVAFGARD